MYSRRAPVSYKKSHRGFFHVFLASILVVVFIACAALFTAFRWYSAAIGPLDSDKTSLAIIAVQEGTATSDVAAQLEEEGLIQSARAYSLFVRFNPNYSGVQAGEYEISPSMSVSEIAMLLSQGQNTVRSVTILPAQRLDQISEAFVAVGYSPDEVASALDPVKYVNHPALIDKPASATLEGYLYPETFNVGSSTPLSEVVTLSLDETARVFTAQVRQDLRTNHDLSVHEAIILASIVEREVSDPNDRTTVAQVFLSRLELDMSLGSDPTALYGALISGLEPSVFADTIYNTRLYPGLPPGPINNISESSVQAVTYPADSNYLFFVSGDDGTTYFSNTLAEHEALTAQHCIELCQSY